VNTSHKPQVISHKFKGLIFVVSGPSGSGKTTLAKKLLSDKNLRNKLAKSISWTTRPKRSGERDKKDYVFVSQKQFAEARQARNLLEWTEYMGYYYATPGDFIEEQIKKAKNVILCLDLRGAFTLKRLYPRNVITIFIMPPSISALLERMTKRCCKTKDEEVRQRLKLAQQEVRAANRYDYCLVNKDLRQAIRQLKDIISQEIKGLKTRKG